MAKKINKLLKPSVEILALPNVNLTDCMLISIHLQQYLLQFISFTTIKVD